MGKIRRALFCCCIAVFLNMVSAFQAPVLSAQTRLNDKDIEALMRNLKDDSKTFRSSFDDAIKKSSIRKTSQEKDARSLVASFEKQTDSMLSDFKKTKKGDVAVETTINNAQQIEKLIYNLQLSPKVTAQWEKVRSELDQVSSGFGITARYSRM